LGKAQSKAADLAAANQAQTAGRMSDLAGQLVNQSAPWRATAGNTYSALVSGDKAATDKALAPQYNLIQSAADTSKRQAEATMPSGGQLEGLKRYLSLQTAGQKSAAVQNTFQDALQRLATMAMGGTQQGISSFGGAGQNYGGASGNYANLAQIGSQNATGIGQGIGSLVSMI
jgi:hypothetical protein